MSKAEEAYKLAQIAIAAVNREKVTRLDLTNRAEFAALDRLPPEIGTLFGLEHLALTGTQITDLDPIRDLSSLTWLLLAATPISDLSALQNLTALEGLALDGAKIVNLTSLRNLTALGELTLAGTDVAELDALQGLKALDFLTLGRTRVSDLTPLRTLRGLGFLTLEDTQISDLSPLRDLTALRHLTLDGTLVADLTPLRDLATLQSLSLVGCKVSDLSPVQGLTALRGLNLNSTKIVDVRPLRHLTALHTLSLRDTRFLQDLRPIAELTNLIPGTSTNGIGLHFLGCAACDLDPEGLGKLAAIENDKDRTEQTLEYLQNLTAWPPRPGLFEPPEQDDVLRVAPNAEGKLDVLPAHPSAEEVAERLKQTLYLRLQGAVEELVRTTGNQQAEVCRRARSFQGRIAGDFATADLVDIYIELDWVRGEYDRRGEREGEDRFSNAAVAALHEINTVGPGLVLENAEVEKLEERRRRFADNPLPPDVATAHDELLAQIAAEPDAFGQALRNYALTARLAAPDPIGRRLTAQRILNRNTVIAVGCFVATAAVENVVGDAASAAARWVLMNQTLISTTAAAAWGDMFLAWLTPIFDHARTLAASGQAAGAVRPLPSSRPDL